MQWNVIIAKYKSGVSYWFFYLDTLRIHEEDIWFKDNFLKVILNNNSMSDNSMITKNDNKIICQLKNDSESGIVSNFEFQFCKCLAMGALK